MKNILKRSLWTAFCWLFCVFHFYAQEIPISVQGVVRSTDGSVFPTGNYSMRFRIYNVASGGTAIWTEEQNGIRIEGGVYSVLIGKITPLGSIAFNQTLYLGVSVDGGTELSPRALFTAAPAARYAFRALGGIPSGMIVSFAGTLEQVPDGWLPCDGRALKSSDFPVLHDRIGTTYGNGSSGVGAGAGTNFNVPDLRGEFVRGLDIGRGIDANRAIGTVQDWATAMPLNPFSIQMSQAGSHTHSTGFYNSTNSTTPGLGTLVSSPSRELEGNQYSAHNETRDFSRPIPAGQTPSSGSHTHSITSSGGGDTETRPVNTAVYFFIKY